MAVWWQPWWRCNELSADAQPFGPVRGPGFNFTASFNTSNNYTTTTWTAVAIGAAAPNRCVIVSLHTDPGTVTPTAVTVGGINATLLQANDGIGLFIALVPTGTT